MTIEELINRINAHRDPDPDSDWKEVDRNYTREPYEDSLMSVCREIERKVKGALWT